MQQDIETPVYLPAKEIGMREVILTIRRYLREGRRFWYVLLAAGLLVGGYRWYQARSHPVHYEAAVGFIVSNESGGGGNPFGGVLGQLGLGGGGGGTGVNLKRVMTFATSNELLWGILLDSTTIDGQPDLVINHLLHHDDLVEYFELEEVFAVDRLTTNVPENMSPAERAILKMVHAFMIYDEEGTINTEIGEETGLMRIYALSENEELAEYLARQLFERLSNMYTLESTGQSLASVKLLQSKADSLLGELTAAEYQMATIQDTRQGLNNQRDRVRQTQLGRRISILSLAYTEVVRNLETAKFTLSTQTPFFQVLEEPFLPLRKFKPRAIPAAIWGFAIGFFVAFALVCMRRFYLSVIREADPDVPTPA